MTSVMMNATSIELLADLCQFELEGRNYDFHNNFNCTQVLFSKDFLVLRMKEIFSGSTLGIKCSGAKVTFMEFDLPWEGDGLTIDSFYRGRAEVNGSLLEFSDEGCGYFYLEFFSGQKLEFWAREINIEEVSK